ncbi:hypothetical protein Bbelb_237560 [Branchiostoma belcheri]|nr:hypothetical protein Bbelb_237560 [Branchiostoma belcheri]
MKARALGEKFLDTTPPPSAPNPHSASLLSTVFIPVGNLVGAIAGEYNHRIRKQIKSQQNSGNAKVLIAAEASFAQDVAVRTHKAPSAHLTRARLQLQAHSNGYYFTNVLPISTIYAPLRKAWWRLNKTAKPKRTLPKSHYRCRLDMIHLHYPRAQLSQLRTTDDISC